MRAAVVRDGALVVEEMASPRPTAGNALLRTLACGICGSDRHYLHDPAAMGRFAGVGGLGDIDPTRDVVLGHELCAEVVAYGPGAHGPEPGTTVTTMPVVFGPGGDLRGIGFSPEHPGGFGELLVAAAPFLVRVPAHLTPQQAALTEPLAVGRHAVARAGLEPGDAALVHGCGPVGLAIVAALADAGVAPIVATDLSPRRRSLAAVLGAHEVVDPRTEPGIERWRAVDGRSPLVVFEAVGGPMRLQEAVDAAERGGRVVVAGVCVDDDVVQPMVALAKELDVRFALAYTRAEFRAALESIAEGRVNVDPLITGVVGLDGLAGAIDALGDPEEHCKVIVEPAARTG